MHARMMTCAAAAIAGIMSSANAQTAEAPPQYEVTGRIPAADGGWDYASVDADNGTLYVARSDGITAVDLATRKVTDKLATAQRGHAALTIDGGKTVFETDGATGLARFVSAADGKVLAEVRTGAKPDAVFIDGYTGMLGVMNADDGSIALIDPKARTLAAKIKVGGGLEAGVADGRGNAYVNIEDANAIARIDLVHRRRIGTIALPGCEGPTGLALVANGRRLITACDNGTALVIDPASGRTITKLAIGAGPDAVILDEARGRAFIPSGTSGTLAVISTRDADHIRVVQTLPTQRSARTGAVDPRDGKVYLPAATLGAPEAGAKRGKPLAGSFVILVISPRG